jgi:hypothetical protein
VCEVDYLLATLAEERLPNCKTCLVAQQFSSAAYDQQRAQTAERSLVDQRYERVSEEVVWAVSEPSTKSSAERCDGRHHRTYQYIWICSSK